MAEQGDVDELLRDPWGQLDLPEGAIVTHGIVMVQYLEPGSDNHPQRPRLAYTSDINMPPWIGMGMCSYGHELELQAMRKDD